MIKRGGGDSFATAPGRPKKFFPKTLDKLKNLMYNKEKKKGNSQHD
jgi:hypothetical protein